MSTRLILKGEENIEIGEDDSFIIIRGTGEIDGQLAMSLPEGGEEPSDDIINMHESAWVALAVMSFLNDEDSLQETIEMIQSGVEESETEIITGLTLRD